MSKKTPYLKHRAADEDYRVSLCQRHTADEQGKNPFRVASSLTEKLLSYRILLTLLLLMVFVTTASYAQVRSATLSGNIQDPAGRSIAGASVTVLEVSTSQTYTSVSNETGSFTVPYLPSGTYTVKVVQPGFETSSQTGITIGTGESIHLQVAMKIGATTQVVEVRTESGGIQVDSPTVQTTIGETVIAALPNIAHNPLAYVGLQAGVNTRGAQASQSNAGSFGIGIRGRRQISDFAINGGQAYQNDVQLDGLSTQGSGWNEVTVVPNQDAIQEVRALVNNYSAQYGRAHGLIATTTKGGTDDFHGMAFMRNRTSALAANSYANNALGIAKPASEIWTYGGTIGGPIKKTKAFFFASFEGLYYDNPLVFLATIPTAAERKGDFSNTKANVGGNAVPLNLYDPFKVTQTGSNAYSRALIAGANTNNSTRGTDPIALNVLSNYPCAATVTGLAPCTNRAPDDAFNTNNYQNIAVQAFRKSNVNARVDYHLRQNNYLYISGGYTHGNITTPPLWGTGTLWNPASATPGQERFQSDRNPYLSVGNTLILSPTLVLDFRYGINRINSQDASDIVPDNFDYTGLGISPSIQPYLPVRVVPSFTVTGGNWTVPNNNSNYNKHEHQTNQVFSASMTKSAGRWNYKVGGEFRAYLANYTDSQTSALYTLSSAYTVPNINSGGSQIGTVNANDGGNPWASFLLGVGSVGIPGGQAVHPAFLHQYGAIYTQNDWRPTDRLTLNFGLRWDWQPAITERYGRVTSIDITGTNPFGSKGSIYFPGANGNGRRMWDTDWSNFQPRLGFAYRATDKIVVRGGAGVSFLPANTGFFGGAFLFGTTSFSAYTNSQVFGFGTQNGTPAGNFYSGAVNQFVPATNSDVTAPALYGGVGGPRFPVHGYKNPYVYQGNLHIQQDLGKGWSSDLGYNVEVGKRLGLGSSYTPNSDQFFPDTLLQTWRANYISRNGTGSTGTDQVANPFQPAGGPLLGFAGNLGKSTMPLNQTLWAYPYLGTQVIQQNRGFSTYHALQATINKDFSHGLQMGSNFTWAKSLGVDGGTVQNNTSTEGIGNVLPYLADIRKDKRLSANDIPIRFAGYFVYRLPFGTNKSFNPKNAVVRGLVSDWKISGTYIWQSGVPQQVSMAGSLNGLPDRVPGVPLILPKSFQHFYDGNTSITLPNSGRTIKPCNHCFLKFNPDAFKGRTVTTPNGSTQSDVYYYGNAAIDYGDLRSDPLNNITLSIQREFKIWERLNAEIQANASNLLNHTQFAPTSYTSNLGNIQTGNNPASGVLPGYGSGVNYGTHSTLTLDPRLIELQARIRF